MKIIRPTVDRLEGKRAWGVSLGFGSFITLEFGSRVRTLGGRIHGEWHLWIYDCAWRIEKAGKVMAASEDDRSLLRRTVMILNRRKLTNVKMGQPMSDTVFAFEGGVTLKTFGVYSRDAEHWMLFTPGGKVLTIGPGSAASFGPAGGNRWKGKRR